MLHAFGNTRMKFVAGAVLLCLASVASAQSAVLVGGGATLPAAGYAGDPTDRLMTPDDGSLLAAYNAANGVSSTYCQTGSGGGKNVLAGTNGNNVNIACVAPVPPATALGFGGTGLTQPHFVGSDSPLSAADYTNYTTGHTAAGSQPLQIPVVSGAVGIVFNQPQIRALHLSEEQVCRIFSGDIKTWQDSRLQSAIVRRVAGTAPTGNITVAYRSDGSGTSFSFTNHLTAKCGSLASGNGFAFAGNNVAPLFTTNQDFSQAASAYIPSYFATAPASGNQGVINAILANTSSIGYVEAANSLKAGTQLATVRNDVTASDEDPGVYGGTPLPVTLTSDKVISATLATGGRPQFDNLPSTPSIAGCVKVVDPAAYAVPQSGYPIVAVSYFLANARGNGLDTAHVRSLMLAPYTPAIRDATFEIGDSTGLSFLAASGIDSTLVNACVVN